MSGPTAQIRRNFTWGFFSLIFKLAFDLLTLAFFGCNTVLGLRDRILSDFSSQS